MTVLSANEKITPALMMIRGETVAAFMERVRVFHGYAAPGVLVGGFMVDLAYRHLPEGGLFNALCETPKCLPDAVQLLTPCTIGNGRLTIVNTGRYALTMYDKLSGAGVRVFIDLAALESWPELKCWFLKLKEKDKQDCERLMNEVSEAGSTICRVQQVKVAEVFLNRARRGRFSICPSCGESYPLDDGDCCGGCRGRPLYV